MNLRGDHCVFKAALFGVTSALLLSTSTLVASAADSPSADVPAAVAPSTALPPSIVISGSGAVTMAPIPDTAPAPRATARVAQTAASAASSVVQSISLTERPAIIIKDGTIMMAPIPDNDGARAVANSGGSTKPRGELNCLARAVYFEARSESTRGQEAVAQVVLARKRTPGRPKTVCGVVYEGSNLSTGCQFSFTCDGIADTIYDRGAWARAQRIATKAMRGKLRSVARGATYYHASYVRPYWASHMVKVATIGTHIFYRP